MVRVTQIKLIDRMLLVGPPGIGKTEVIRRLAEEEARELGKEFVDLREASDEVMVKIMASPERYYVFIRVVAPHVFPEDLGVPQRADRYVEFVPPKALKVLSLQGVHGVLFIDELSNVQRDDQISMYYSLILEKEAGFQLRLSRNVKVVCVGNPPEWSEIVRPMPKPLRNRMAIVEVSPPTVDEWVRYMNARFGDRWERLTVAYLKAFPGDFIKAPADDYSAFPTPRSWTQLAALLHELRGSDGEFLEELVVGCLGKEVGTKFAALLKTKIDVRAAVEELRRRPEAFASYDINTKILVAYALAQRSVDELKALESFLAWMNENEREFLTLTLLMMDRGRRAALLGAMPTLFRELVAKVAEYI
jgi:DNA polymerase III delta prime subunit